MVLILEKIKISKNKLLVIFIIIIFLFILKMLISKIYFKVDKDYQKLGIELKYYNIAYYTVYENDYFSKYKVYKLNLFGEIDEIRDKIEKSSLWSKNKFYEYVMMEFYERIDDEIIELDREDLYYYDKNGIYAIFDIKNAKLYYSENYIWYTHKDYREILGIETKNYKNREIYSVRGGPQNDGTDYYTYEFNEEKGNEIEETLSKSQNWKKEKLDDNILDCFKYNEEVKTIENGYYYYKLVCRTSDENKKYNFSKEEATGWEIGVYDVGKNILYYYWTSY